MAKKPVVEVDEELLRSTMLGDVPILRNSPPDDTGKSTPEQEVQVAEVPKQDTGGGKRGPYQKKKKEEDQTYRGLFLVNDGVRVRVSTYINRDTHEKIKRLLSIVAPDISIASYINNILSHHLEQYQDEIGELYRSEISKPLLE